MQIRHSFLRTCERKTGEWFVDSEQCFVSVNTAPNEHVANRRLTLNTLTFRLVNSFLVSIILFFKQIHYQWPHSHNISGKDRPSVTNTEHVNTVKLFIGARLKGSKCISCLLKLLKSTVRFHANDRRADYASLRGLGRNMTQLQHRNDYISKDTYTTTTA